MRDDVRQALQVDGSTDMAERTIDITATGRRSGEPRRFETVFYNLDGAIYLSGIPFSKPRAWLLNMQADPQIVFHLKQSVVADLPAVATVITDAGERRAVLTPIVEQYNARRDPEGPYPPGDLDEWVRDSPLARVDFPDA